MLEGKDGSWTPLRNFWASHELKDLNVGMEVLWSSPCIGKRGGPSTKVDFFHGTFHGWDKKYSSFAIVS